MGTRSKYEFVSLVAVSTLYLAPVVGLEPTCINATD